MLLFRKSFMFTSVFRRSLLTGSKINNKNIIIMKERKRICILRLNPLINQLIVINFAYIFYYISVRGRLNPLISQQNWCIKYHQSINHSITLLLLSTGLTVIPQFRSLHCVSASEWKYQRPIMGRIEFCEDDKVQRQGRGKTLTYCYSGSNGL